MSSALFATSLAFVATVAAAPDRLPGAAAASTDAAFEAYRTGHVAAAQRRFLRAARGGDPRAAFNAALLRLENETSTPPLGEALALLRRSADAGFAESQRLLATLYETGRYLPAVPALAAYWYERAARQGDLMSQLTLATNFFVGSAAVPADPSQAAYWYRQAAEAGDPAAQYILASMLERGFGVAPDVQQALDWYSAAGRQGDVVAALKAKELASWLAREQSR
ncbi:MAG: tetratricopeptide repeat protein [Lautropia sp.]